jgi:hypothetical protein
VVLTEAGFRVIQAAAPAMPPRCGAISSTCCPGTSSGFASDLAARALPVRLAAVLAGVGLVALGSALYIGAGLGSGPRDSLMLALAARQGSRSA